MKVIDAMVEKNQLNNLLVKLESNYNINSLLRKLFDTRSLFGSIDQSNSLQDKPMTTLLNIMCLRILANINFIALNYECNSEIKRVYRICVQYTLLQKMSDEVSRLPIALFFKA